MLRSKLRPVLQNNSVLDYLSLKIELYNSFSSKYFYNIQSVYIHIDPRLQSLYWRSLVYSNILVFLMFHPIFSGQYGEPNATKGNNEPKPMYYVFYYVL